MFATCGLWFPHSVTVLAQDDYKKKPRDGVYTYGLFFEGGRWDKKREIIDERLPKVTAPRLTHSPLHTSRSHVHLHRPQL